MLTLEAIRKAETRLRALNENEIKDTVDDAMQTLEVCRRLTEAGITHVNACDPLIAWVEVKPTRSELVLKQVLGDFVPPLKTVESAKHNTACLLYAFRDFPGVCVKMVVPLGDASPCKIVELPPKTYVGGPTYILDCTESRDNAEADSPVSEVVA
jgi:hypothetical protein